MSIAVILPPVYNPIILSPVYISEKYGELIKIPDNSIINVGGVGGSTFTVGGKSLIFSDGTLSDGSNGSIRNLFLPTLQESYDNSTLALIKLIEDKDFTIEADNGFQFSINASTGSVTINGNLVIDGNVTAGNLPFDALDILSSTENFTFVTGNNVQEALESIDYAFKNVITNNGGTVQPYHHIQEEAAATWIIQHNKSSKRVQISIWDTNNELLFSDNVRIVDENTIVVSFSTPANGSAILMIF